MADTTSYSEPASATVTGASAESAASAIQVEDPATGAVIARVPVVAPDDVAELVDAPAARSRAGRRSGSTAAPRCSSAVRSGSPTTPSA